MFKECEKACIFSQDGVFIAEVKVLDSHKDSMGLIFNEEDIENLNTETVIVFYDGIQGLVTCKCSLSARVKITGTEVGDIGKAIYKIPCHIEEMIGVEQRRSDLKIRIHAPVMLETTNEEGKVIQVPAKLKDISAGGLGLESEQILLKEQLFSFLFVTDTGSTRLKASILWSERLTKEEEPPLYRYGCRFFDLNTLQESMVRKFVFQEQLKNRKIQ